MASPTAVSAKPSPFQEKLHGEVIRKWKGQGGYYLIFRLAYYALRMANRGCESPLEREMSRSRPGHAKLTRPRLRGAVARERLFKLSTTPVTTRHLDCGPAGCRQDDAGGELPGCSKNSKHLVPDGFRRQ